MIIISYNTAPKFSDYKIIAGKHYLFEEELLNRLHCPDGNFPIIQSKEIILKPFVLTENWNGKQVLIIRHGGFGDLLIISSIIKELKERWEQISISVCCGRSYSEAIVTNKHITHIIEYPINLEQLSVFDAAIHFAYTCNDERLDPQKHILDLFAENLGLPSINDKTISLSIPPYLIRNAKAKYPKTNRKRIGIQVYASSVIRTYPVWQTEKLIMSLRENGFEIFLFGSEGQVELSSQENILNLTNLKGSPTFLESAAIMTTCDLFIAPDSSLCHVAGALNIPTIALFGPFPSITRTKYATSILSIDGIGACAPCFHHTFGGNIFPSNKPCEKSGYCTVLGSIQPEKILELVIRLSKNKFHYE